MKKIKIIALSVMVAGMATSCQKSDVSNEIEPETSAVELSKKHQVALLEAGVNPYNAVYATVAYPDGTSKEGIAAGTVGNRDIFIALDNLVEQALATEAEGNKQYRTRNLVSRGRTINVVGYTGGRFALTNRMRNGLSAAVRTYNSLNLSLRFNLRFAATTNADMVIYNAGGSNAGGQAEFPQGGRPGKFIQIFGGMDRQSSGNNTHVMIHEMGHALGFRHTDYARRRCDGTNEGASNVGAIRIPGTPSANRWGQSGLDSDSVMISCFGNEDGRISRFDRIALQTLY
ncbi:peptidase [Aquimarina sp. U1-2]|uniref:M57 family metalloprotease n=1 Tax=Aquimarina sp. U1-2 TaxID=2823141 RepID=UPI001AECB39B|nr:M57 family metalloprotease [Aquimarina sp. U1-2]MBP2830884.1 peptidase [Aquimarina sp. U1-2]